MRSLLISLMLVGVAAPPANQIGQCLHEPTTEDAAARSRRLAALVLARRIHNAQAEAYRTTSQYLSLATMGLPAPPEGFEIQLVVDQTQYMFWLTDTVDSCRWGYVSNQRGIISETRSLQLPSP